MLIFIVFASCLLYPLSSGQMNTNVSHPTVGSIGSVANNGSVLNFTFIYPMNYQFDKLYINFTIYDFIGNDALNPQPYRFSALNFTNSNFSLPWVVPPIILQSGDYVIACFEWIQTDNNDQLVSDTYDCVVTRALLNNTFLAINDPISSAAMVTNTTATVSAYFPKILPFNQNNITSTLNGTILPSTSNSTSNDTYSSINTFTFTNLTSNTCYNMCVNFTSANSLIVGSGQTISQCQIIKTLDSNGFNNSSNRFLSNITSIILLFLFAFI